MRNATLEKAFIAKIAEEVRPAVDHFAALSVGHSNTLTEFFIRLLVEEITLSLSDGLVGSASSHRKLSRAVRRAVKDAFAKRGRSASLLDAGNPGALSKADLAMENGNIDRVMLLLVRGAIDQGAKDAHQAASIAKGEPLAQGEWETTGQQWTAAWNRWKALN